MLDSTEEGNKQQWTVKSTKLLLELYKERKEKFRDPKIKKRNLWTEIIKEMDKNYKHMTEDILDRKLCNLKKTFRIIKDNNRKNSTGRERITWEYYDIFEEIFLDDRTINFGPTISSMDCAVTQCSSSATSTILSPQISTTFPSTRLIVSHEPSRLSTCSSPVRMLSPALIRYMCRTPSRTSIPVLMSTLTHSSDFFDSMFIRDSIIEENINSFYSNSSSSSSSVAPEHSFSETASSSSVLPNSSEYINQSTQRRKKTSKETYDLRKQLLYL